MQQNDNPEAIFIQSGVIHIDALYEKINDPKILAKGTVNDNFDYMLKRPLYINDNATLIIDGNALTKTRVAIFLQWGFYCK